MLALVEEGRIRPFSGKGQQAVFRASDVDRLAQELGVARAAEAQASQEEAGSEAAEQPAAARPRRRRDPIKLIGTRLSMDSRWAEITNEDLVTWLDALEPVQYERVRKVVHLTMERLNRILQMMEDQERAAGSKGSGLAGRVAAPER